MLATINEFFKPRINNLIALPRCLVNSALSVGLTATGVVFTPITILAGERNDTLNKIASLSLCSTCPLCFIFTGGMKIITPSFTANYKFKYTKPYCGIGIITGLLATPFFQVARNASKEEKTFWEKHVISRSCYALGAIVATVTRLADLALGLLGAALSVATLGKCDKINSFAVAELGATGLIYDICISARGIFKPSFKPNFKLFFSKDRSKVNKAQILV